MEFIVVFSSIAVFFFGLGFDLGGWFNERKMNKKILSKEKGTIYLTQPTRSFLEYNLQISPGDTLNFVP
jgi:uncharacterized membrane protein